MKTLVTGATGYIGKRLVTALSEKGHEVRVMTRVPADFERHVEQVSGNLALPGSMMGVTEGIDTVFHLGGGMRPSDGDFQTVNVEGTKQLMVESIRSGVKRFVFVSTATVYGDVLDPPAYEYGACEPLPGHIYAMSKLAAEQALQTLTNQGTELIILRPAQVYSAYSPAIVRLPKLASLLEGNNYTHFVHREDVIRAAALVAEHPNANGIYNVADDYPLTVQEAARLIRMVHHAESQGDSGGGSIPPMLKKVMEATLVLDTNRIRNLGFQFQYACLQEGIKHD